MTTKKVTVQAPSYDHLKSSAFRYPEDYKVSLPELIRTAYVGWIKKDRESEYEFTFPGHGVLTMLNRNFVFTPTDAYRAAKGYEERIEGRW